MNVRKRPLKQLSFFVLALLLAVGGCSDTNDGGESSGSSTTTDRGGRNNRDQGEPGDDAVGGDSGPTIADQGNRTDGPRIGDSGPSLPPLGSECTPGDENACADGLECLDGYCRSRECVAAANARSYLGCDYLAADLPNLAYAPMGGTPDAPLGVVLANSSPNLPAPFWVNDANGNPAELIAEVTVEPPNVPGIPESAPVTVFTMLTDSSAAVVDERYDAAQAMEIPGGGMAVILLPHHGYLEDSRVSRQAYQIRTERPVAAYQFGPYCCNYSFTNDASLLLPVATLGTEYRYVGVPSWGLPPDPMSGSPAAGYPAYLTVIGTRPGTVVTINLPPGVAVQPDSGGRITISGTTVTATLAKAEVMHLASADPTVQGDDRILGVDLSGARISATAPVAVFSGHLCTFYPQDQEACDHLEEQLFPVDTWGNEFALVPPVLRTRNPAIATEAIFWKLVADRDGTVVTLSVPFADLDPREPGFDGVPYCGDLLTDTSNIALGEGEFCEFGTRAPVAVTGNLPFQVMGIISGQASTGFMQAWGNHAGDPAIFLVPPLRQFRLDYQFLAPTTYWQDFVTVIVPPDANLTLDGDLVDLRTGTPVPGQNLVFRHLLIDDGPHVLRSSREFGIQVFAWDDYVSYAFTGGLNLTKRPE